MATKQQIAFSRHALVVPAVTSFERKLYIYHFFVASACCSVCDFAFAEALCLVFRCVPFVTFPDNRQAIQRFTRRSVHILSYQLSSVFYTS